ncbi:hypothetical protein TIFTF001_013094 [Ficus carica]|uniref:Uncharacterized protein n=1 Tax=Ficus carica TaxID=3494 RepID=A0AA88A1G2_FICCA|nr:hypothetical protein TIFTF001_013094 [Ficus carica]
MIIRSSSSTKFISKGQNVGTRLLIQLNNVKSGSAMVIVQELLKRDESDMAYRSVNHECSSASEADHEGGRLVLDFRFLDHESQLAIGFPRQVFVIWPRRENGLLGGDRRGCHDRNDGVECREVRVVCIER